MSDPQKPDHRLQSAESAKQQAAASRETSRPSDSVPVVSGQFANLPATFGRYQVERLLGRGAMGAVYLARDTQLDRLVALKIPKVTASGSKKLLLRLETEAKAAAKLDHPSLCKVHDAGEINGQCFIAMQYIEGQTLKAQLDVQSKASAEAVSLILQLAEGLSEAHALGIIHRDLKPENIMINQRGLPVIMDFGLAKFSTISSNAKATQAGTILGSPAYMSPEQASGNVQEIDQRSDIYALGTILFEMLTGELPFAGSAMQILGQKSLLEPASPSSLKPDMPPRLAAICHKMIAKNIADRHQDLAEVMADLKSVDFNPTPPVTPLVEVSPFASLVISDHADERTAKPTKLRGPATAQGARDSRRAPKTRIQQLALWWNGQSQPMKWATLGAAAFLILCGAIFIRGRSEDRAHTTTEVADAATVAISATERKETSAPLMSFKQVSGLTPLTHRQNSLSAKEKVLSSSSGISPIDRESFIGKVGGEGAEWVPGMKFRWCPPGSFTMGSPKSEQGRGKHEEQVDVTFSSGFWLGETEVTQGQWESLMETAPWKEDANVKIDTKCAASYLSYEIATLYCERLTERERTMGRLPMCCKYELPTEAQWEYACRAGTNTTYGFGDDASRLDDHAWYAMNADDVNEKYPHEVGTKSANAWGLRDMLGNVLELCADWYGNELTGGRDPVGASTGWIRACRGGSWRRTALMCRIAFRDGNQPHERSKESGLRVALTARDPTVTHNSSLNKTEVVPFDAQAFAGKAAGEGKELVPGMNFRWCPADSFTMGSPNGELGRFTDEVQVAVTLSQGFWLGETEVTQGQWKSLLNTTPWKNPSYPEGADYPAIWVNHDDANFYCQRLSELERKAGRLAMGWKYTLPTEAQWEYACRAGMKTRYNFGDDESRLANYAWFEENATKIKEWYAHEVGKKNANAWGLRDMHGNVWEWCSDWYGKKLPGGRDPGGESAGWERVYRGGSWNNVGSRCASAFRSCSVPHHRSNNLGFRVAGVRDVAVASDAKVSGNQSINSGTINAPFTRTLPSTAKVQPLVGMSPTSGALGQPDPISSAILNSEKAAQIPADASTFKAKRFKLFTEALSWHEARKKCQELGGRLAEVRSNSENKFLKNLATKHEVEGIWLGATDEVTEGHWLWSNGQELTFQNWNMSPKHPNNKDGSAHYLLMMVKSASGEWCDQPANSSDWKTAYICEWDVAATDTENADEGKKSPGYEMPKGGKVVKKGSFTAWTVPKDPAPNQEYIIVIQVKYKQAGQKLAAGDVTGTVMGTDKYRLVITNNTSRIIPEANQVVVPIPGAAARVRDLIRVHSAVLSESQVLQIEF